MDGQRFDLLARHFAAATSRRQVLKSLAAGLGATLLGASRGSAKDNGGNSDCAHFCKTVFSPGRARGQCTSDAAHGQGLCPACGADVSRVCVAPDGIASCPDRSTDPLNCGDCNVVCPSGACVAGACLKLNGDACGGGGECLSTFCADGVCCDAACGGQCEACTGGTCLPIVGPPVGGRPACASDGSVCGGACGGADPTACVYPGTAVDCADPVCRDGDAVPFVCDGGGACVEGATDDCGLFVCRDGACLDSCSDNDDCLGRPTALPGSARRTRRRVSPAPAATSARAASASTASAATWPAPGNAKPAMSPGSSARVRRSRPGRRRAAAARPAPEPAFAPVPATGSTGRRASSRPRASRVSRSPAKGAP